MIALISFLFILWLIRFVKKPSGDSLIYSLFLFPPAITVLNWPVEFYVKRWVGLALLLLVLFSHGSILFKKFPLKKVLVLMFLESCILILPDSRFDVLHRVMYPLMDALDVYLPLFLGFSFVIISRMRTEQLLKPITICCIIVEIYGLFNLVTGMNPVEELINNIYSAEVIRYTGIEERAIVRSLYRYSFDFGFNSALLSLLFFYYYLTQKSMFSFIHWVAMGLSALGIFLCGSRSVIVSAAVAFFVFIVFMKSGRTRVSLIFLGGFILIGLYFFVPAVSNIVNMTISSLTGSADYTGSSTDMRFEQLDGSLSFMNRNPILGNGFKYIFIDLDWKNHASVQGMAGFESLLFSLMIERGVLGLIIYLIFFLYIISFFLKYSIKHVPEGVLGLSTIVLFLIFAFFTGALDAWLNSMVICGVLIALIVELKTKIVLKKS